MTTTEIRAEIRQRNALRKAALLPLLDEQESSTTPVRSFVSSVTAPSGIPSRPITSASARRCSLSGAARGGSSPHGAGALKLTDASMPFCEPTTRTRSRR